eukprot:3532637-Lingulodinium_polyedra.AAC.1
MEPGWLRKLNMSVRGIRVHVAMIMMLVVYSGSGTTWSGLGWPNLVWSSRASCGQSLGWSSLAWSSLVVVRVWAGPNWSGLV